MLDNIPHIKAYWIMMTPSMAQIAQRFGANDIDGTVVEEKIYHDAGATTAQHLRRQDLLRLIREAGREPVERDTAIGQLHAPSPHSRYWFERAYPHLQEIGAYWKKCLVKRASPLP